MRHLPTAAGLSLALAATPALPATYVIAPDGTGDFPTIQDAVDVSADGDEILLEDGTFVGSGNRDVDFLGKAITIRSLSGIRSACVVDCEDADSSGFRFRSGEGNASVLADLTVTRAPNLSPAVEALSSSPTLRNVAVTDAGRTAIRAEFGAPVLTGCLLESNTGGTSASWGVSLLVATATIEDCVFSANVLDYCVYARGGTTTIRRCEFDANTHWNGNAAGAIYVQPGTWNNPSDPVATIEDCTVTNNRFGILLGGSGASAFTVRDCEITGNTGIGLSVGAPSVTVTGCGIRQNGGAGLSASGGSVVGTIDGCEILQNGGSGVVAAGTVTVSNCTSRENTGAGFSLYAAATVTQCASQGNAGAGVALDGCNGATVRQCLVTGNGRGFHVSNSPAVTVEDCTVASNHAAFSGGAMQVSGSGVTVLRSILWGNCSDADGWEIWQTAGSTVDLDCVTVETSRLNVFGAGTFTLANVLEQDPLLCSPEACAAAPSAGGLYGLSPDSPALAQPCGPMGAPQPLCTAVGVQQSLEPSSWGTIKAKYRE